MSKTVEVFFDFVSTASYLAYMRLPDAVAEVGGKIEWRPMLLGGVFKATGNAPPMNVAAKGKWMMYDIQRWTKKYDIPFRMNPAFPFNTVMVLRGALVAQDMGQEVFDTYMETVFKAIWQDGLDMSDPQVVMDVLRSAGLPADEIAAATQDQKIKDRLKANTDEAVSRGAFGAPTFFVGDEMHWGQDRIHWVVETLAA